MGTNNFAIFTLKKRDQNESRDIQVKIGGTNVNRKHHRYKKGFTPMKKGQESRPSRMILN